MKEYFLHIFRKGLRKLNIIFSIVISCTRAQRKPFKKLTTRYPQGNHNIAEWK